MGSMSMPKAEAAGVVASVGSGLSEVQKLDYEEKIKNLEKQLLKAQEGQIGNTD